MDQRRETQKEKVEQRYEARVKRERERERDGKVKNEGEGMVENGANRSERRGVG